MILKTEKLSHKYAVSWAIRDINIQIPGPGITGLLGANGAGKSTTMNIICGTLSPTEGEVFIDGIHLQKNPLQAKKMIGFLPQNPPLYTDLTVEEYLTFCAELRLVPHKDIKKAVEEAKERCNISHVSSRLIKNLSGGYRQRVGIAQAIIHKPKLVILDEPTNGLDPNQLLEVRKLIREIAEDHAVLFSSHILSEISLLCRDIIMIDSGKMVFSDSMDAFDSYASTNALIVGLDNPPSSTAILQIPGVSKVEFLSPKLLKIVFEGSAEEATDKIVSASVSGGWRLKEIGLDKGVLDEVFKQFSNAGNIKA